MINQDIKSRCMLRPVKMCDAALLLEWVNDPEDRANSFSSDQITFDEHTKWLKRSLSDPNVRLYMLAFDGISVGHIKLRIEECQAEIGYSISPKWRGRGFAKIAIALVAEEVRCALPQVASLIAQVKPTNVASIKALEANGYTETMRVFEIVL